MRGSVLLTVSYSRLRADARIAAWVKLLALTAAHPETAYEAITIGRLPEKPDDEQGRVAVARIPPLADTPAGRLGAALEELGRLVALREEGLREPLPLPSRAGAAYAQALLHGGEPRKAAEAVWTTIWGYPKEDQAPESQIVFGGALPADALLERYAPALWEPLLSREAVEER